MRFHNSWLLSDQVRCALLAEQPGGHMVNGSEEAQAETGRLGRRQFDLTGKGPLHMVNSQEKYSRQNVGKIK